MLEADQSAGENLGRADENESANYLLPGAVCHPCSLCRSRVDLGGEAWLPGRAQARVQPMAMRDKNEILDDTVSAMLICSRKACHNDLEDGDIDD